MSEPVAVLAHSPSAAERARQLYAADDVEIAELAGAGSLRSWLWQIARRPPRVLVLVDIGDDTAAAAVLARFRRIPTVLDTGDLVFQLERSRGTRSLGSLALIWVGERAAVAAANHVVVRGMAHAALLGHERVTFAPDVAPPGAGLVSGDRVRRKHGLSGFVVGVVGTLNRAPRLGVVYGWDIVEALAFTDDSVQALIVGSGPGLPELESRAESLGVAHRCRFAGQVDSEEVAEWIGAMDVAVSTQTNDLVGAVRTTGKLPLYLACGMPVLATDVGEAKRLLGPLGWTIPYHDVVDSTYPQRLAAVVEELRRDPGEVARRREQALDLYRREFDVTEIRGRIRAVIDDLLSRRAS
jgi:glycosyltransferase involved in cell wall biosynthesis